MAFDRLDGLQETPIEIIVPKFYIRYTKATEIEGGQTEGVESKYERVGYGYDIIELWNVKNRAANNKQSKQTEEETNTTYRSAKNTGAINGANTLIWIHTDIDILKSLGNGKQNTGLSWLENSEEILEKAKVYITKTENEQITVLKTLSYGLELYETVKELGILSAPIVVSRMAPPNAPKDEPSNYDPATAKLRETLKEMRSMPRDVIRVVRLYKKRIEKGTPVDHQPMVKSVIVANLLKHVSKGRFRAIELVFDQIDGKLTRTIKLLGGKDVFVDDNTTLVAPAGSILDENGKYICEEQTMKTAWLRGFAQSQKGLEILAEGLDNE